MYDARGFAEAYDLLFRARKDYPAETVTVLEAVRGVAPHATSLLDVACGTGEHLRHLVEHVEHAEGVDLSAEMCRTAAQKLPDVAIHQADMRDFDLGRRFDAVLCLFSSFGHLRNEDELKAASQSLVRHTAPGGVVVVEPWLFPESMSTARPISQANVRGHVAHDLVETESRTLVSAGVFTPDERGADLEMHYLVADENGIDHYPDKQRYTLFSQAQYAEALRDAGCARVEFMPPSATTRGLFVGAVPA